MLFLIYKNMRLILMEMATSTSKSQPLLLNRACMWSVTKEKITLLGPFAMLVLIFCPSLHFKLYLHILISRESHWIVLQVRYAYVLYVVLSTVLFICLFFWLLCLLLFADVFSSCPKLDVWTRWQLVLCVQSCLCEFIWACSRCPAVFLDSYICSLHYSMNLWKFTW